MQKLHRFFNWMGTSSRTPASENEGAGRLSLRWSVTIPVVKLLLLHSGRLHASAVADPCSKALIGLTNYLHCRDYLFKGQNSTHPSVCGRKGSRNLSVLAIISGSVLLILYKCSFLEPQWCVNSQGAFTGLEETAGIDLPCQCAFSAVYLTSCAFPWVFCFLAARLRVPSGVSQGSQSCALGERQAPCSSGCLGLETNTLLSCLEEFQKVPGLLWGGRYWTGMVQKSLEKETCQTEQQGISTGDWGWEQSSGGHARWRSKSLYCNMAHVLHNEEESIMFRITGL